MADKAHIETDERLEEMERHLSAIFSRAQKETGKAWKKYLKESSEKIAELQKAYDKAKESGDAELIRKTGYRLGAAKREVTIQNKRFKDLTEQTAQQILHINETALAYINGELPAIYALNYNALEPQVENIGGYSFTLTDPETVKNLATKDETLLPYKIMDGKKDVRWNTKKINAEVLQGILQGESMDKIAGRLSKVLDMDKNAAIRNARTTVTSAECKGRQDSYIRAKDDGIQLQREWVSAIDKRTRHAHVMLDGQIAEIEKPFNSELGKIMYPGDPSAAPANVYNCRCTLVAKVIGFAKGKTNKIRGNQPKTTEEFSHKWGIECKGIKGKTIENMNKVFEFYKDEFDVNPEEYIDSINTKNPERARNYIAYVCIGDKIKGGYKIDLHVSKDYDDSCSYPVLIHEFAHAINYKYAQAKGKPTLFEEFADEIITDAFSQCGFRLFKGKPLKKDIAQNISDYGSVDSMEAVAEVLRNVYGEGNQPNDVENKIMQSVRKWVEVINDFNKRK